MEDRELVLGSLPSPLGGERPIARVALRTVPDQRLWERFVERLQSLGGEVRQVGEIAGLAGRCYLDADVPPSVRGQLGEPVQTVWQAEAGVTVCELAVAETGSLLLAEGEGRSRLASLAPPLHVCLVDPNRLVAGLDEAVRRAPMETCWLISGPSRTADIEGVMVNGVHGPKRLWVVPLPA
jgi:hypothetical protein